MGQRNINSTNQMLNLEHDQQAHFPLHPQPIMNRVLPVAEPMTGFVPQHLSGSCENHVPYGIAQYNAIHHPPVAGNAVLAPANTSNYYNPYISPPGVFPPQGPQFVDSFGAAFKRKGAEGYYGNVQLCDSVAGPSSAGPLRPAFVGGETMLAHNPNNLIQGNYAVQGMIPANAPWLDQRFSCNGGDGGAWAWGQAPRVPYIQGSGVNGGFTGMSNMVIDHYPETAANRIPLNFQPRPPPPMFPQGHPQSLHHLPPPVQGPFYPQVAGTSYRPLRNSDIHANLNTFQGGVELDPRYVGPLPLGVVFHHPSHGRAGPVLRHHALPHLNVLSANELAMLEMGNAVDHHRDMRLDVDSMSYEELLALGDHIGTVTVGLSEDTISNHMETRTHIAVSTSTESEDRETDFCVICQNNYENQDQIGTLDCGHEFHVDCVKTWLIMKNICPVCKSSALTTRRDDPMDES